jgi:hypothetical protein
MQRQSSPVVQWSGGAVEQFQGIRSISHNAGSALGRVAVQCVIMRGCPLAPFGWRSNGSRSASVRHPSRLAPRCENLHRAGPTGRLRAATPRDLARHRKRFGERDGRANDR